MNSQQKDACRRPGFCIIHPIVGQQFPENFNTGKVLKTSNSELFIISQNSKNLSILSIDRFWIQKQESTLREFQNTDILVLGNY